ncbi:MAG: hypothetical protein VKN33_09030 [Candidatus Sericytochromatia bacterium]|nr:hypothetical protein [Candidatus Sericytochromatia bacterium]
MHLRDRLIRLKDDGRLVVLFFGPHQDSFLSRLLRVGHDYIEFEACEPDETVVAHHIMPLALLVGVTVSSVDRQREQLELLLERETEEGEAR